MMIEKVTCKHSEEEIRLERIHAVILHWHQIPNEARVVEIEDNYKGIQG
jgi:hypothetical protein